MRGRAPVVLSGVRCLTVVAALNACGGTLDAGSDSPDLESDLPVGATNTIVLSNDGPEDNWQGEIAFLLTATGLDLAGLVINDSSAWPNLDSNLSGWRTMREAAEASGILGLPEPTASSGPPLVRPASGEIADTVPNHSQGAELIVRIALDAPNPPLVVITGGRLTDVADAYLIEPAIAERLVVVASLGELSGEGAVMGIPNGEMDPWANTIVVKHLRYVQVSAYYDQLDDVPSARLPELPQNAFGEWIANKSSQIFEISVASDQVALLTVAVPEFAREVQRATADGTAALPLGDTPKLAVEAEGNHWLVTSVDGQLASQTFWSLLSEVF